VSSTDSSEQGIDAAELETAFKLIHRFTTRATAVAGQEWEDGRAPESTPAIVVGDGIASRSTPLAGRLPWVQEVRHYVELEIAGIEIRQFSYLREHRHYDGRQTTIRASDAGERLPVYLPKNSASTCLLAFSWACPIFLLRLVDWLTTEDRGRIPCLVLLQPAFAISPLVSSAWRQYPQYSLSVGLAEALDPDRSAAFHAQLIAALESIQPAIPVHLRYWAGDRFLAYPPALMRRIEAAGMDVDTLEGITFPPEMRDPFQRHCYVSRDSGVLRLIATLMARCVAS